MSYSLDLSSCEPANHLWADFSESLGLEKASQAVRQALDLQEMTGKAETLPVLFVETCGIALTTYQALKSQTGLSFSAGRKVLIFSSKRKFFQVLNEIS